MCCKCLYGLLFIVFIALLYLFVPLIEWANWITALSTFVMAIIAYKTANTWKKNLNVQKKISVLTDTNKCIHAFQRFLDDYMRGLDIGNEGFLKTTPIDTFLDNTNEQLHLMQIEAEIMHYKNLEKELEILTCEIKSYFVVEQRDESGSASYTALKFKNRYIHDEQFSANLKLHLKNVENICKEEFKKIYN